MKALRGLLIVIFSIALFFTGFYLASYRPQVAFVPLMVALAVLFGYIKAWKAEEKKGYAVIITFAVLILPAGLFIGHETFRPPTLEETAKARVRMRLKDPYSAQFRNQRGVCGEVNAKNAMGAFTGYKRFVAATDYSVYFDTGSQIDTEANRVEAALFDQEWSTHCAGRY